MTSLRFHQAVAVWVAASCIAALGNSPAWAAEDAEDYVVIKVARVITVSGEEFAPGTVVVGDGKIMLVGGRGVETPDGARVIEAPRETVMPGFVHPHCRLDLPAVARKGVHGDWRAADEVYPELIDWSVLVEAGYTAAAFHPDGTGVAGRASVYRTAGPDGARMLRDASYLRVTMSDAGRDKKVLAAALKKAKSEIEKVEKARQEWEKKQKEKAAAEKKKQGEPREADKPKEGDKPRPEEKPKDEKPAPKANDGSASLGAAADARDSAADGPTAKPEPIPKGDKSGEPNQDEPEVFKPPAIDPAHQPLVDLIQKKAGAAALVELGGASDLRHLDDALKPYESIAHHYHLNVGFDMDYAYVVEDLGKRQAKVVMPPGIFYLPLTVVRYNLAARLAAAGCEVSLTPWSDNRVELGRMRMRIADLLRAGLGRSDALKSLTLHPARIAGVDDQVGAIEKGKDADLVFFRGDPLDPHAPLSRVMIRGEMVWEAED